MVLVCRTLCRWEVGWYLCVGGWVGGCLCVDGMVQ